MTSFGLIGKVPTRDDFIHVGASDPIFSELDGWLAGSVEWANARRNAAWPDAFATGGPRAFVFRSLTGDGLLAGTMSPSADRAGRQFPVVVALPLGPAPATQAAPHGLPLILENCWQLAGQLAHALRTGAGAEVLDTAAAPQIDAGGELREALGEYDAWVAELPLSELWALLHAGTAETEPGSVLRLLVEAVRVCRGVERPTTPLSLRFPLGGTAGAGVCFWIDLVRRLVRWRATVPSFFWSHDGASGELLLHLGAPPPSTAAELWLPSTDRDEICDLRVPLGEAQLRALPELPPELAAVLANHGTAWQLLAAAAA